MNAAPVALPFTFYDKFMWHLVDARVVFMPVSYHFNAYFRLQLYLLCDRLRYKIDKTISNNQFPLNFVFSAMWRRKMALALPRIHVCYICSLCYVRQRECSSHFLVHFCCCGWLFCCIVVFF